MLIFNFECIISFRFENLFWCLDETLINRQLLQLQFWDCEVIYHDKNTSRHFLLKIFHFQGLKEKGQFDENLRSYIPPRG